ncbi:MAG: hypothetical protein QXS41_01525, partial [Candidatus Woesearchaeota archaeon]
MKKYLFLLLFLFCVTNVFSYWVPEFILNKPVGNNTIQVLKPSSQKNLFSIVNDEKVIFDDSLKVGIGTTSPSTKLHVEGDAKITGDLDLGGHLDWKPFKNINLYQTANDQEWSIDLRNQNSYTGGHWHVWSDKHGTILAVRGDSGNVGIGTTSPSTKLHVEGDAKITGDLDLGGHLDWKPFKNINLYQ